MTFEEELAAAFAEVGKQAMPVRFMLSNAEYLGVCRMDTDETPMNEVGYEPKNVLVIVAVREQFGKLPVTWPQGARREILQVLDGPYLGKWVLTDVEGDLAHFTLKCSASE